MVRHVNRRSNHYYPEIRIFLTRKAYQDFKGGSGGRKTFLRWIKLTDS